jgi:acetone carboxylase gamma subunit
MHVQHWLADEPDATKHAYRQVACPACTQIHFVNAETGKLLGEK